MKKAKPKLGQKILIIWHDAFGKGGWNDIHDVEHGLAEPIIAEIIGYLVKKDRDFYVLSMGVQGDQGSKPFLHLEFIPRGCVKEITLL